ncbi:MAG: 2-deoxy-D-gluconate 3-dehydrogenase [Rhodospirillaceae bacterium]|nr:2-deoxy-D-gluconate 3-dehydrogenase [Rhodospirillaceae bacterium]HAA91774.1 2-deoxy-D-gluconate 3-dehydrogenase [Rhodospirillaceae bacterium]
MGVLDGKTALVTGASSGLGAHMAKLLSSAGAKVAIAARRRDKLEGLAEEIGDAVAVEMDVLDSASVTAGVAEADKALGGISILINNSGVAGSQAALDVDEAEWDRIVDTNLKGAWLVAKSVAEKMVAGGGGSIVNTGSVLAFKVQKGTMPYGVSKAGLVHMTKMLAAEWARYGIRVNAIAPGYIETDINRDFLKSEIGQSMLKGVPQRRFGEPEDLDGAVLLLASDASAYITGVLIPIDGGHTLMLA